jgi:hypothetical protein
LSLFVRLANTLYPFRTPTAPWRHCNNGLHSAQTHRGRLPSLNALTIVLCELQIRRRHEVERRAPIIVMFPAFLHRVRDKEGIRGARSKATTY